MMRTLYLCYFGLREPLVQTQVLPYLRELSRGGIGVGLLTFEPDRRNAWSQEEAGDWCDSLQADGIRWFSLPYHKRPSLPATTYDIAAGGWMAARLVRRHGYDVVHARAHVAAAMGAIAKRLTGCRLIFDIRGFNPEEYVDAGVWPENGLNYRLAKRVERQLLSTADGFVVLTEKARDILFPGCSDSDSKGRPVEVIPCCVDLARFEAAASLPREQIRRDLGVAGRRVMVYVGALGGYYLTEEMAELLAAAHRQDASTFSMILTQSSTLSLSWDPSRRGWGSRRRTTSFERVRTEEIPRVSPGGGHRPFLHQSHPIPSWQLFPDQDRRIPGSGLPIICNAGIGDLDEIIEGDARGGACPGVPQPGHYEHALADGGWADSRGTVSRPLPLHRHGRSRFDLESIGGERYCRLYHRLLGSPEHALAGAVGR